MSAYIIVDIKITDPEQYQEYARQAGNTVKAYGGEYLVRTNEVESLEGTWIPPRIVVLKFKNKAQAKAWWSSEEYHEPKATRQRASVSQMILVDGYAPVDPNNP